MSSCSNSRPGPALNHLLAGETHPRVSLHSADWEKLGCPIQFVASVR
jgi:hypothetical protein